MWTAEGLEHHHTNHTQARLGPHVRGNQAAGVAGVDCPLGGQTARLLLSVWDSWRSLASRDNMAPRTSWKLLKVSWWLWIRSGDARCTRAWAQARNRGRRDEGVASGPFADDVFRCSSSSLSSQDSDLQSN